MLTTSKQFQIDLFCFWPASEILNRNCSWTRQTENRDINNKYLINLAFSVRTVSYGSSFFPLQFMTHMLCAWAINRRGKKSLCNLQYGPGTRLVKGMYKLSLKQPVCKRLLNSTRQCKGSDCLFTVNSLHDSFTSLLSLHYVINC